MRSTFMGLEASKRGLFTQQSALYTTGHNIANANTEGYSRQRVNMQPTLGYPGSGLNAPKTAGHIGTGVEAGSVQRIWDAFVDQQYRQETNKLGYWEARSKAISQLEDVLNEPSDYGLAKALDEFWNALQDLHVQPEDGGARAVVVQRAIAVADSFHYIHNSIQQLKENAGNEIGILLRDANSVLQQIAQLNHQIQTVEPNGYMPNDLYDERDKLLDQLSTYFPIELEYGKSGGNALPIAEGPVKVYLKLKDGTKVKLIDGKDFVQFRIDGDTSDGLTPENSVQGFKLVDSQGNDIPSGNDWDGGPFSIDSFSNLGKLKSLVDSFGYVAADGTEKGLFPEMLEKINTLAKEFAEAFNNIHTSGTDLDGAKGVNFFVNKETADVVNITAGNIYVSNEIVNDPNKIAASNSPEHQAEPGNGKNALALANLKFNPIAGLGNISVQSCFEGIVGQLGVDGQQAQRLTYNALTLQQSVSERRASISSVSLDEEMTNMIAFQQAYNANARMITVIDETLDKIINGMGRVGL